MEQCRQTKTEQAGGRSWGALMEVKGLVWAHDDAAWDWAATGRLEPRS